MISTSLSFVCDILLFLFFSRHRIPVPRPDVRRLACLSLPLLAYASYRLFFGYTLVSSSGWSNAAIFLSEISIAFLLNTLLLREGRRFALMQAVLFGLSLQVGRKTSFHVVLPFLDPFFASVPHPFLLSLVSFVSLNALKLLFVLPLVTPAQTEAENDIRPLQLLPLLFAVHITLVVDVFLAASGPVHLTLVCYLSAFVCTLLSNLMLKKDRQLADMAKIQDNMRLSYALALQKEESDEQIRRMVHDLRHQLTALEAGEHREEALKELRDSLEQARPVSYSDHPVLNAVLTEACQKADPTLLEPIMKVSIEGPTEFQGNMFGLINQRRGVILETTDENNTSVVNAEVPLSEMFGYATDLRSKTQGRGLFTMQFDHYEQVPANVAEKVVGNHH